MKAKILPYFCFFIAALGFAWYASRPNKDEDTGGREWTNLPKAEINKFSYQNDNGTVTAERDAAVQGAWWLSIQEHKKQGDQVVDSTDRFLANDTFNELINGMSPFRVEKQIGTADKVNFADFGFDKPSGTFEVSYGEGKLFSLTIGKRSFQSPHVFVLDKQKNMVLLVERRIMSMLDKPKARLALIKPFSFEDSELRGAELSSSVKTLTFKNRKQDEQLQWFADNKPEVPHEAFRNWLDKFLKLRIEGYPNEEQKLALGKIEGKMQLKLLGEKGELESLTLLEEPSEPIRYWLKTSKLPVPVQVDGSQIPVLLNDMTAFLR